MRLCGFVLFEWQKGLAARLAAKWLESQESEVMLPLLQNKGISCPTKNNYCSPIEKK